MLGSQLQWACCWNTAKLRLFGVDIELCGPHNGSAAALYDELPGHKRGMYVLAEQQFRWQSACTV